MDDRGAASVVAVVVGALWFGLVAVGVHVGEAVVVRHRVGAAADLGALAAAGELAGGDAGACARAGWVVERMGGRLDACLVRGWEVEVRVSADVPVFGSVFGSTTARARAGPAEP
ncbi:Rv3654c family TadE-like protein [Actinosynnema sp. NPDC053489]|uniref:Rv3654c family TadE-like protein n=1 Tax=Actinosynnema sp. NPDC053489 TaxID=3363916 RepID=UPI0037C8983B